MDGWIVVFLVLFFPSHPLLFLQQALQPLHPQSGPQSASINLWLSVFNVPPGWCCRSALLRPRPPPLLQPPALTPQPLHPLCSQQSPAAPHIPLVTPTFASLALLLPHCIRFTLTRSDTQSAMSPVSNYKQPHTHAGHIKPPPVYSVIEVIDWIEF